MRRSRIAGSFVFARMRVQVLHHDCAQTMEVSRKTCNFLGWTNTTKSRQRMRQGVFEKIPISVFKRKSNFFFPPVMTNPRLLASQNSSDGSLCQAKKKSNALRMRRTDRQNLLTICWKQERSLTWSTAHTAREDALHLVAFKRHSDTARCRSPLRSMFSSAACALPIPATDFPVSPRHARPPILKEKEARPESSSKESESAQPSISPCDLGGEGPGTASVAKPSACEEAFICLDAMTELLQKTFFFQSFEKIADEQLLVDATTTKGQGKIHAEQSPPPSTTSRSLTSTETRSVALWLLPSGDTAADSAVVISCIQIG